MILSGVGIIADVLWYEIKNHAQNVELGDFVVMPNHIHGIVVLNGNDADGTSVSSVVSDPSVVTGHAVETGHALSLPSPLSPSPIHPEKTPGQQRFQNEGKNTLSSIIGGYKSAVTKHAHRLKFVFDWQSRFHDHIIRNEKSFHTISQYIQNNPLKWPDDKFFR